MTRVLFAALVACSGSPKVANKPPQVDTTELASAVQRAWSWSQHNDMSTQTWTYVLRAGTVDHSLTTTYVDGRTEIGKLGAGTYDLTPTGALALHLGTGDELAFTAIVASGPTCDTLLGRPCRTLGWNGFLAQDPTHTRYRREFDQRRRDDRGLQTLRYVTLLRFARPLTAPGDCALDLEIVAAGIVDSETVRPASGDFHFACDITPNGRGRLSRLTIRGFTPTDSSASTDWANHVSTHHLVDDAHARTQELFGRAFEPVMYFDPADPDTLYLTGGFAYWSEP